MEPPITTMELIFLLMFWGIIVLAVYALVKRWQLTAGDEREISDLDPVVDPWVYQRHLMLISDQALPVRPQLNKTSILYGALILEEVGETMVALGRALEFASQGKNSKAYTLAKEYARFGVQTQAVSKFFRDSIAELDEPLNEGILPLDLAVDLLDGATDVMVVTSGLALAAGLPGQQGYHEVASSNLSKANPSTGRIDKTPDGKWIKGSEYRAPSLASTMAKHYTSDQAHVWPGLR